MTIEANQMLQTKVEQKCFKWNSENCLHVVLLGRVAVVRGVAAYSHQTFPWTICRSVRRSVRRSSNALWKNGGSDPDAVWHGIIGRRGPGMKQVVGFGDRSTGRGTFGSEFGARHCNQRRTCRLSQGRGPVPKLLWADLFSWVVTQHFSL